MATPKARNTEYGATTGWTPTMVNWEADEADDDSDDPAEQRQQHGLERGTGR